MGFTASKDNQDMAVRVKNNLVVLSQATVLFEDRLLQSTKTEEKFILQRLQGVLGFRARRTHRKGKPFLETLAAIYVQARTQEIISIVRSGRQPELPADQLTALLVTLIDRRIFFLYRKRPFRVTLGDVDHEKRVSEYLGIVSDHINGSSNAIFLYPGAMITGVDETECAKEKWKRPWELYDWRREFVGADAEFKTVVSEDQGQELLDGGHADDGVEIGQAAKRHKAASDEGGE